MKTLIVLVIVLMLSGCAVHTCKMYGVKENGNSKPIRTAQAVSQQKIDVACGVISSRRNDYNNAGCMKYNHDGTVDLYWIKGDQCVREHEFCHAKHGPAHTKRYYERIYNQHSKPACPI